MSERMRVKDKVTGNILESSNDIVIETWKANPDRFILPKNKPSPMVEQQANDIEDAEDSGELVSTARKPKRASAQSENDV